MVYLALARRYRPTQLAAVGRVYEPTPDEPYRIEVCPWMNGSTIIAVEANGCRRERVYGAAATIDDQAIGAVARKLYVEIARTT